MQLRVNVHRLNKRRFIPAQFPEYTGIVGQVLRGYTFEGIEVASVNIPNVAMGTWYRDRDGYYYWGGGLEVIEERMERVEEVISVSEDLVEEAPLVTEEHLVFDPNKMSWGHALYDIPFIWSDLKTQGEGVTIAVLDTGMDIAHADLTHCIHPASKSFIGDVNHIIDTDGHGTRMAGIIAGAGTTHVCGIAPKSKILVLKIAQQKFGVSIPPFIEALNYICTLPDVDIVSISYSLKHHAGFQTAIQKTLAAGKIILGAIGNNRNDEIPTDPDTFPACYNSGVNNTHGNEVIAIGAFNRLKKISSFSNFNAHLSFIAPGETVRTTQLNQPFVLEKGTSIATAFTAGCLALMLSYGKTHHKPALISASALLTSCDDVGTTIGHDPKSGFGYMNLRNAISKIKS